MAFSFRFTLLLSLVAAVALAPSARAHPPHQHGGQLMPFAELQAGLAQPLPASGSFSCEGGMAGPYPCKDVDLESFTPLPQLGGATGNDIWGWTDPKTGAEIAIMGSSTSTGFVDVSDPQNPRVVGVLPTRGTPDYVLWRDVKVDGNYAFIVSEISGSGLQVFDLTRLRGSNSPTVFTEDASYDRFSSAHNIAINTESDYAYAVGTDTCGNGEENGGLHMVDISDPLDPRFAGCAVIEDADGNSQTDSNNYVHDVECMNYSGPDADYRDREICFGSNENVVAIYDVTDKANPRVISTTGYDSATYTHQGSTTPDRRYFLFGDELDEQSNGQRTTTYISSIRDLDAPGAPKPFEQETRSIDHNLYIHGKHVYESNYMAGLRILDYDRASLRAGELRERAFFDVVPALDEPEFAGTWSNYRFPGSGTTVVSAIENELSGLFVLSPRI